MTANIISELQNLMPDFEFVLLRREFPAEGTVCIGARNGTREARIVFTDAWTATEMADLFRRKFLKEKNQ